jgi:hypothetical protein
VPNEDQLFCRHVASAVAVSSFAHLGNPYKFIGEVARYGLTSPAITLFLAAFLPLLQLTLGIAMCIKSTAVVSSGIMSGLFFSYALAQLMVVIRGSEISCGCFGDLSMNVGSKSILLTITLMVSALIVSYSDQKGTS